MKQKILVAVSLFTGGFLSAQQTQGDLSVFGNYFVQHDSSMCASVVNQGYDFIKQNSFLNDTIKVIDFSGQPMYTLVNTSGSSSWSINNLGGSALTVFDYEIDVNNYLNIGMPLDFYKVISGIDTLYWQGIFVNEYISNPCAYNTVTGKTFIDKNNDCVFNSGDVGVGGYFPHATVYYGAPWSSSGYPSQSSSSANGDYNFLIQESYFDSVTLAIDPLYQFTFPPNNNCSPYSYSINALPQTGLDFVLQCADIDVRVNCYSSPARPTVPFNMTPSVSNFGCDTVSGTLNLIIDPNVTYNPANSSNPADVVSGDTLKWFYTNITNVSNGAYWQSLMGGIELTPSAALNAGDVLNFEIFTGVPSNDVVPSNNAYNFQIILVNSYDPNFKEVSPKGVGTPGFISANTEKLTYTIHFQNTGNAPALNISVLDSLEGNVIPSTLRILNSSHAMSPEWVSNDVVKFKFNNINLPDSTSNEPQSHGFVSFEIDMVQNLSELTEIKNKAYIYFDNNSPVITNNTLNTIEVLGLEEINGNNMTVTVYPNPSTDFTTISLNEFDAQSILTLKLIDVSGKVVLTNNFTSNKMVVNTTDLDKGVYFYSIWNQTTQQFVNGKLIVN